MTDITYTSTTATERIAERVVREADRNRSAPIIALKTVLLPTYEEIRNRGKLPRNRLRPVFNQLVVRLQNADNVVDLSTAVYSSSKLSANDIYNVRCIQAVGLELDDMILFLAIDIILTRQNITLFVNSTEFSISSHLLARYMQRGRKSVQEFLSNVMRPMRVSSLISARQLYSNGSSIALPMRDGLLVGYVSTNNDVKHNYPLKIVYNANGSVVEKVDDHVILSDCRRVYVRSRMKTFIDRDSLNINKQQVLDDLETWEQKYHEGIDAWFQAFTFGSTRLRSNDTLASLNEQIAAAIAGCAGLIDSLEWQDLSK